MDKIANLKMSKFKSTAIRPDRKLLKSPALLKHLKNEKYKKHCFFYIIKTKSNWKILFTDWRGGIIVEFSAKSLFANRRERVTPDALNNLVFFFFKKFKKTIAKFRKKVKNCIVRFLGSRSISFKGNMRFVLGRIKRFRWTILSIENRTPIPFNGCRLRKKEDNKFYHVLINFIFTLT